jgi:hypothetical protein
MDIPIFGRDLNRNNDLVYCLGGGADFTSAGKKQ